MTRRVVAAAGYLRSQGVNTVVLIGASMGGTAVLVAAPQIAPAGRCSGKSVRSGPFSTVSTRPRRSTSSRYRCCTRCAPGDSGFADDAQTLSDATRAGTDKKLVVAPNCNSHGVQLADRTGGPEGDSRPSGNPRLASGARAIIRTDALPDANCQSGTDDRSDADALRRMFPAGAVDGDARLLLTLRSCQ